MACFDFSDTVIEHFLNPRNAGILDNADAVGSCGDPSCGDTLTLMIKVEHDTIVDIRFQVFGCVAAIASSSMTTVLSKGKTLQDALKITDADIAEALDGLPEQKMHCSVLGAEALKNTIEDYYQKCGNAHQATNP